MAKKDNASKVVLITGASAGIGQATAARLLHEGYIVYGAARRVDRMADLQRQGLHSLKLDVTDEHSMVEVVDTVIREQGRIDVLFNNAGFGLYGSIEEVAIDDARHQFEVNLFGLARLTQLIIPQMRKQGSGIIINNSSIGGKVYSPLGAWYYATKHALEGWSDCLRIELQQFGIKVVIIEPGLIKTEFGDLSRPRMEQISSNGPYKELAASMNRRHVTSMKRDGGNSSPAVIARVVSQAMRARRPKTRYVAGKFARLFLSIRRWQSDRACDWIMTRIFFPR